jgi:hypothetical protein
MQSRDLVVAKGEFEKRVLKIIEEEHDFLEKVGRL